MKDAINKIITLSEQNISTNPSIVNEAVDKVAARYSLEIGKEAEEALAEVKENNAIYLADELGDVFWDFMQLVVLCKKHGLIENIDDVFAAASEKYTERMPAFVESNDKKWDEIKKVQKERMILRHKEKYGN